MTKKKQETPISTLSDFGNMAPFYRIDQAGAALGLADATLRKYFREGKLKGYKRAGRIYFLHGDIVNFITGK